MKKKGLALFITMAASISLLTGCGSSKYSSESSSAGASYNTAAVAEGDYLYDAGYDAYEYEEAVEEKSVPAEVTENGAASAEEQNPQADRKLITTMNVSSETENFDELMAGVERKVQELGGYIERSELRNNNYYNSYGSRNNRYSSMTIRIPAKNLENFIAVLEEKSNILNKSKNVEDVTLAYVDLESHKKALLTEQDRLLELLEMAETVEDMITVEDKLAEVRYQLESMESQLRTYDNKINYSTVYLDIQEVERLTPEVEVTIWGRIKNGFGESLYNVGVGIRDFFVNLIINLPYIVVWIVVLSFLFFVLSKLLRFRRKRKAKRALEEQADLNSPAALRKEKKSLLGFLKKGKKKEKKEKKAGESVQMAKEEESGLKAEKEEENDSTRL